MKKVFEVCGREVEFTDCTAIHYLFPETGRKSGVYVHYLDDKFYEYDGIIFGSSCPMDEDEADLMLSNEFMETYEATLDTVEMED